MMAGKAAFKPGRAPGESLVTRVEISARVRPTAARASGFFCRFSIVAPAECCRQLHSSSKRCRPVSLSRSSGESSILLTGSGGGASPYAKSMSMSLWLALRLTGRLRVMGGWPVCLRTSSPGCGECSDRISSPELSKRKGEGRYVVAARRGPSSTTLSLWLRSPCGRSRREGTGFLLVALEPSSLPALEPLLDCTSSSRVSASS